MSYEVDEVSTGELVEVLTPLPALPLRCGIRIVPVLAEVADEYAVEVLITHSGTIVLECSRATMMIRPHGVEGRLHENRLKGEQGERRRDVLAFPGEEVGEHIEFGVPSCLVVGEREAVVQNECLYEEFPLLRGLRGSEIGLELLDERSQTANNAREPTQKSFNVSNCASEFTRTPFKYLSTVTHLSRVVF
jgi:hypothetical protein